MRFVGLLIFSMALSAQVRPNARIQDLAQVHSIYVDSLGDSEGAVMIRQKIVNRLASSKRFRVVTVADDADAVMEGSGEVILMQRFGANGSGGTRPDATLVVRLVSGSEILWVGEAKNNYFSSSASSSVADQIVGKLMRAVNKKSK